jgi:UDP:flavonoid glycosyltransferase YjiC (YdhE family)
MAAGLSPCVLLHHSSEADRRKYPALHFSPVASSLAPLLLSAKECTQNCQTLRERCWEDLTDEAAFTVLYPDEPYDPWMARCRSRLILSWALAHRAALGRTQNIPFYGRVLPSTLMDEVEEADLVASIKTSPERVFHTLGIRQILAK